MLYKSSNRSSTAAFGSGALVGTLGGLIGLGGAEFRLPLLIGLFGFQGLEAVILNKATSLIVVASALPFRATAVPWSQVGAHWPEIINLLAGSLAGAWVGAEWATRLKSETLHRIISVLLLIIAAALVLTHGLAIGGAPLAGGSQIVAGVIAGFAIGIVASLLGVAGGEFLIPTLILLFGADIKLAGSLSLAVSLPTMLMGFVRYSRDQSFKVVRANRGFLIVMAAGSVVGTAVGGLLVGTVSDDVLLPLLAALLVISAVRLWRHN